MNTNCGPTLAGFLLFLRNIVAIPVEALPDNSPSIEMSYCVALELTLIQLKFASPQLYTLAVYNLGASNIINWAVDQPGQTYFADMRAKYDIRDFVGGVISSASDVSTSESMEMPDFIKGLTIGNLQQLKDPFGRQWMAFMQDYGTIWGIS